MKEKYCFVIVVLTKLQMLR